MAYGGKVYLMAAVNKFPNSFEMQYRRTFVYDPPRNEWTELASMPVDGIYAMADDRRQIYSSRADQQVAEYAPATNQWREPAPRPSFTKYG